MPFFKSKTPNSQPLINTVLPELEHCAIALSLDMDTRQEHIIIGELEHINLHLAGINRPGTRLLFNEVRPFGTMVEELFCVRVEDVANAAVGLRPGADEGNPTFFMQCIEALEDMFCSDNMIWRFIALRFWQEYRHARSKARTDEVCEVFQSIALPLRFGHKSALERMQNCPTANLHQILPLDYFRFPAYTLYKIGQPLTPYQASDLSVFPLFVYYLNTVYSKEQFFQYCKRCGKMYPANTAKMKGFCSEECRKAQARDNKRRFDDKIRGDEAQRAFKNCYMYWYNRLKKIRRDIDISSEKESTLESAFVAFKKEGLCRKKQVHLGAMELKEYREWLFEQQAHFDDLTEDVYPN